MSSTTIVVLILKEKRFEFESDYNEVGKKQQ